MKKKVKWLLAGTGDIARRRVAPALAQAEHSELVGVCGSDPARTQAVSKQWGVPQTFLDLETALRDSSAEAVYVASPVWLHVAQVLQVLRADKHVLVEKPLGLSFNDCRKAIEAARKSGKVTGCAYYRRSFPRYQHVAALLNQMELGRILSVRMSYDSWFNPLENDPKYWRVIKAKSGGGPLSDMGSHMIDVVVGLFGEPVAVSARCDNLMRQWDVEDSATVWMKLANDAHVTLSCTWCSKAWRHEFEIVGMEGRLQWLPYDSGPVQKTIDGKVYTLELPNVENVHLPLVEDFVEAVLERRKPLCTLEEAATTNAVLDAIYQSSQNGCEVRPHRLND